MNLPTQLPPWMTLRRAIAGGVALTLLAIYLWPRSEFSVEIVLLTMVPAICGAALWAATFWHTARVQIGRRKLKYREVRRIAGIVALACLPFLLVQRFSIYLQNQSAAVSRRASNAAVRRERPRFVAAFAHLQGDDHDRRVEHLVNALSAMDRRLAITPIIVNRTIDVTGSQRAIAHIEAMGLAGDARANVLTWGAVSPSGNADSAFQTEPGFETPFSGTYIPSDFKLPDLGGSDFDDVLRLLVATRSVIFMREWGYACGDALEPLIQKVSSIAENKSRSSGWSLDARARVDFILGAAERTSAYEIQSRDSLRRSAAYFQQALTEWSRDRFPLEWAMTQTNLGATLEISAASEMNEDTLQKALDSYNAALEVYRAHSDDLDVAGMHYRAGSMLEEMARRTGDSGDLQKAIDSYRAALAGYDVRSHPLMWAAVQRRLGRSLSLLADQRGDPAIEAQAIEAFRASLGVYERRRDSLSWVLVQEELAGELANLGRATSNRAYVKQSVAMIQNVLENFPRDSDPALWAELQTTLGHGLMILGLLESNASTLQQAGAAYTAALSALSPDRNPVAWMEAEDGLAETFLDLGHRTADKYYFELSVQHYRQALKAFSRERNPIPWAWEKYNLAGALFDLGSTENGNAHLLESVQCYRDALSVLSREKNPRQWRDTEDNLGVAIAELQRRGWNGS